MANKEDSSGNKAEDVKVINVSQVRNARVLNDLLNEHGTIYIINPQGKPIKVTFASLS